MAVMRMFYIDGGEFQYCVAARSPFKTHVTIATEDTEDTLKSYEKYRKLVGLQACSEL